MHPAPGSRFGQSPHLREPAPVLPPHGKAKGGAGVSLGALHDKVTDGPKHGTSPRTSQSHARSAQAQRPPFTAGDGRVKHQPITSSAHLKTRIQILLTKLVIPKPDLLSKAGSGDSRVERKLVQETRLDSISQNSSGPQTSVEHEGNLLTKSATL